jgi:signal transduction histidine kinase
MPKHFTVDARAMLTWGRESIKDHTTAVLELVKNSYDANATVVDVEIRTNLYAAGGPFVRIVDNGIGMSEAEVEKYWLRLGYSAKRADRFTPRGRRKTGEKGIGRISADRLGAVLELRSQSRGNPGTGLRVEWSAFEQPGRDLEKVPVQDLPTPTFLIPRPTSWDESGRKFQANPSSLENNPQRPGTELLIRELRQHWAPEDVQELRRLLSLLTPPFDTVEDFQVRLDTDVDPACNGVVSSPLMAAAAIEARFSLEPDGVVRGRLLHRARASRRKIETKITIPFEQLVHPKRKTGGDEIPDDWAKRIGIVSARLLFYPQKVETLRGLDFGLSDLREFLRTNAGVRVYRDGIRVPPFGDQGRPEGDWLALGDRKARSPAGPMRSDFRVSPYQLVGAVFIGRDSNPELIDTSGREGLVAGEAFATLKSFLIGCLTRLETHYHRLFVESETSSEEPASSPRDTVDELRAQLSELATTIQRAEKDIPAPVAKHMEKVVEQLAATNEKLKRAEHSIDELGSQAAVSRTLATIGIAAATFGHETQRGLDSLRATLEAASLLLRNGDGQDQVLSELEKAIRESERVTAWGAFALGRVRRDKRVRRVLDVATVVTDVLDEILPAMEASSITLSRELVPIKARVFAMDIECVVINLLTNAYYFTKQSRRDRRVAVRLRPKAVRGRKGFEITIGDSGPGIVKAAVDRIWDPLYTTKTDDTGKPIGTGLGLALVNAVVQDAEGSRAVDRDPKLLGARVSIWLPDAGA